MLNFGSALVAAVMALTVSASASALTQDDYVRTITALGTGTIVPAFATLAARSADLDRSTRALCDAPAPEALAAARSSFGSALDAWMRVEHLAFGPTVLFMRNNRFSFWPDPRNTASRQINQVLAERQESAIAPEAFARGSVALQGFPALERLLFEDVETLLSPTEGMEERTGMEAEFRCRFAHAIAANLSGMAADLDREWRAYVPRLAILTGGPYESPRHALTELFKAFSNQLQRIAELKLGKPLGPSADKASPRLLENWRSDHALSNIIANLEALRELYSGDGFHALVVKSAADPEIDVLMTTGLDAALATTRGIQPPLAGALSETSRRVAVERLRQQVTTLQALAAARLQAALDIPFGFNSMDGD